MTPTPEPKPPRYASRGGIKLAAALDAFGLDVAGQACADLGASTGGFVDCLLQRGAAAVFAVDTAYGVLDYRLRTDPRVRVLERTNALHADPPEEARAACGVVTLDLGWTRQDRALPAALRWLAPDPAARIVSLVKPHYEAGQHRPDDDDARRTADRVLADVPPTLGLTVLDRIESPIRGGKGGNLELLALLAKSKT